MSRQEEESGHFPAREKYVDLHDMRPRMAAMDEGTLRATALALLDELEQWRERGREQQVQESMLAQLRDANENLVLATLNAQSLREEAEAANRRQNEFLAMLAHELRNPLSPISMAATLIERMPDASPQLINLQGIVARQVQHMARLLDDLLDAARVSSGKITLSVAVIPLREAMERAVETAQPRIDERRQHLTLVLPATEILVEADPVRLTQIFSNLLSNASKYTRDGGRIRFSVALAEDNAVVLVEDNGDGMQADMLPHIFDLFTQGPRSLARSEGGLGIGLNVVRNLVHMHGGQVEANSPGPGKGSRFTVTLPITRKAQTVAPSRAPAHTSKRCTILLIEDNLDACNTLQGFLELNGHAVFTAHDGSAGLAMAIDKAYDVLVCDIGLPGLDGFAIIEQLRLSANGARTFAIALSGYGQAEDRVRAIAAGFDRYFVKPVEPAQLLSAIASDDCQSRRHNAGGATL
ncbi:MAG TPA: ATP-binding protein [Oxalicibacterium sp.]|nr:ATP-binding protein [Oxalicibacterium sp.]